MGEHIPDNAEPRAEDREGTKDHEDRDAHQGTVNADDSADNGVGTEDSTEDSTAVSTSVVGYTAEGKAIYETTDSAGVTTTSIQGSQGTTKDQGTTKSEGTTKAQSIKETLNTPVKMPTVGRKREAIDLPRLKITMLHYLVLAVFAIAGYMSSKSIILYSDAYYQALLDYRFSGLPAALLVIACLFLMVFSINAARAHSKAYDTNITNVFEYMGRQDKKKFSYRLESDSEGVNDGVVLFKRVEDNNDTGEPEVVVETLPSITARNFIPQRRRVKVSEIKEVRLVNQNRSFDDEPDFLEPNDKIRRMLKSDRQQLIAFVGAYIFAMFSGFFIALIF